MLDHLPLKIATAGGAIAYGFIPARTLYNSVDKIFPEYLTKCKIADFISGGKDGYHRWVGGHDLFIDVPKTFGDEGLAEACRQTGHLLTDFPTKAGIPIPGFSKSGFGGILNNLGIDWHWMKVSFFDTGIGFLSIAEGHEDLIAALNDNLEMSFETFVDTFVEGGIELSFAISTQNPILLVGAIENLAAGIVSAWKTYTYYVDPIDFFGGAIGSAIVGGLFTLLFSKEPTLNGKLVQSLKNASKSAAIGGLFTVKSFFGYGALLGMIAYRLGEKLAEKDAKDIAKFYSIDTNSFDLFLKTVCEGDPKFMEFWESSFKVKTFDDSTKTFDDYVETLNDSRETFDNSSEIFDDYTKTLNDSVKPLNDSHDLFKESEK